MTAGPSDLLAAVYGGNLDAARAIAASRPIDACEAAALGDADALAEALQRDPGSIAMFSGDGWTPLHLAGFFGATECASLLLAQGASTRAYSLNSTGNTPLHAALAGHVAHPLVVALLDAGADVNALGERAITPLHLAASRGDETMCQELLARGADRDARMDDGTTPAAMARTRGHDRVGQLLEAAG